MNNSPCLLFSGGASPVLAQDIVYNSKNISLGKIYHNQFPSGEWYCQYEQNIRGADVFLIQSTSLPANDNFMQLFIMADAARRASAGRITAIIPYIGYSRQDRKDKPRVPISAKLVMDLLAASGVNRIMTMDLHAQQVQGFTNLPLDHLYFRPSLVNALKDKDIHIVIAPDVGGIKKVVEYAKNQSLDIGFINKKRKNETDVAVTQFSGEVEDRNVLILDDLIESAGTLIAAAEECRKRKAKNVYCAVTHCCLTEVGFERLTKAFNNGIITQFYASNTVTNLLLTKGLPFLTTVNVGSVFARAIEGIHNNTSISSLFL